MSRIEEQRARDSLLDRAKYGEITGDEAEAEAKRLGLERFARMPDPEDFNPMTQVNWTLSMAVSWIAYRTAEAVREAWPAYREKCWHWIWRRWQNGPDGEVHEGWFLEQYDFPSLSHVELSEVVDRIEAGEVSAQLMTIREAREAL